ncbi:MAG: TIGR03546 family protein [Elusimicrobiota bacterium]
MFWLKILKSIMTTLHSKISPNQIAGGCMLGMMIGILPAKNLLTAGMVLVILLLNVNIGSAALMATLFSVIGYFADPLADRIGYFLLVTSTGLTPVWAHLYNLPLIAFTRFNNTVVLGSFCIALILCVPVFLGMRWFIVYYRANLSSKVEQWKIMKVFKLSSSLNLYDKYNQ